MDYGAQHRTGYGWNRREGVGPPLSADGLHSPGFYHGQTYFGPVHQSHERLGYGRGSFPVDVASSRNGPMGMNRSSASNSFVHHVDSSPSSHPTEATTTYVHSGTAFLPQSHVANHSLQQQNICASSGVPRYPPTQSAHRQLYDPNHQRTKQWRPAQVSPQQAHEDFLMFRNQCVYLDQTAERVVGEVRMGDAEKLQKDVFRQRLEQICQSTFHEKYPEYTGEVFLRGFGSVESGFAIKGSDVDLGVTFSAEFVAPSNFAHEFPRAIELALLRAGIGARLLTKTRVPVLKICESPSEELYKALKEERETWEKLPDDKKYSHHDVKGNLDTVSDAVTGEVSADSPLYSLIRLKSAKYTKRAAVERYCELYANLAYQCIKDGLLDIATARKYFLEGLSSNLEQAVQEKLENIPPKNVTLQVMTTEILKANREVNGEDEEEIQERRWTREKAAGRLDFPKTGVGIQCDISFSSQLGYHNTELLRCYSLCDPRVATAILFVKAWAKKRKINSAYSGTMSSYGYVLMMLHFLMNIEHPPVIPNLQLEWPEHHSSLEVDGYVVKFLRDPDLVSQLCSQPRWSENRSSVGILLRNFFRYYGVGRMHGFAPHQRFNWERDTISIRTRGGIVSKGQKGWTAARTTQTEQGSIRQRYLFAIEDPFETDHNVARTVTNQGVMAIREEFRRVWGMLTVIGHGRDPGEGLFDELAPDGARQNQATSETRRLQNGINADCRSEHTSARGDTASGAEKTRGVLDAAMARLSVQPEQSPDPI